jgi:DNA-3-methyladenine glycosylase II
LPSGDYAVRKGFALVYGLKESPKEKELAGYGERWRPFRSVASWYLWRAVELPAGTLPLKAAKKPRSAKVR